jgi:glutamyl-tRNA synthetase
MTTDLIHETVGRAAEVRGGAVCGRYAPSPTGDLHLGNLRTALVAWLQARVMGGLFVVRMEDIDVSRNRPGSADRILRDLHRLGLDWDEGPDIGGPLASYTQLERAGFHGAAFNLLADAGRLFPCMCSRKDIREAASAPHGGSIVYPGTCRVPGARVPRRGELPPAWRFIVPGGASCFHDCLQGIYRQDLEHEVGDFVIRRRDEAYAYQLAVVVDDACMGVTDVVRGDDLIDSTPRQIALQEALDLPTPRYWHVPVLRDERGERMSKRNGAASLDEYCEAGGTPERLIGQFARDLFMLDTDGPLSARELLSGLEKDDLFRCGVGR